MRCRYCDERDGSNLIMSSRLVNGRVETIDICFRCFWLEKFKAEGEDISKGEDGESILSEGEATEGIESVRITNPLGLQE